MTYQLDFIVKGSGFFINEVAGENLGARKLVYRSAAATWMLADADLAATMPVVGLTMESITSGRKGLILLQGYIGDSSWAWTIGNEIYASPVAGEIVEVAPTAPDVVQQIGIVVNTDMIYFDPKLVTSASASVITVRHNTGADVGSRPRLNFIDGVLITQTIADDAISNEIDITTDWTGVRVNKNSGATVGTRRRLNFIEGTDITITVADDAPNDEVDITITNSGPALHKDTHVSGGGDPFVGGDLLDATARVSVSKNSGAIVGTRRELNLIEGANITLTIADDAVNEEVDITIAAAGGGGGGDLSQWFKASDPDSFKGTHPSMQLLDAVENTIRQSFVIPSSITTVTVASVVIISEASGNLDWEVVTNFGGLCVNEDFDLNTDSTTGTTAVTVDKITCIDISAALTGAAAEDLVGIEFKRDGDDAADTIGDRVHFIGIWIKGT